MKTITDGSLNVEEWSRPPNICTDSLPVFIHPRSFLNSTSVLRGFRPLRGGDEEIQGRKRRMQRWRVTEKAGGMVWR